MLKTPMLFDQSRKDKHYIDFRIKIEYILCFHKFTNVSSSPFKVQQVKLYFHTLYNIPW